MKKIIENNDFGIPYTTVLNKAVVKTARSVLGINKINALYDKIADKEGVEFAQAALQELKITVQCDRQRLDHIPRTGPFILIANHPHGALDGLLLMSLVAAIRPDVKFLGNFLLAQIPALKSYILPIDPFDAHGPRKRAGVRQAIEHLEEGSPLVVFPAAAVSTARWRSGRVEDRTWPEQTIKFITGAPLKVQVPVLPAYIAGRNSFLFHWLGKIHPLFRTMRLPLELLGKAGKPVSVVFGSPLPAVRLRAIRDLREAGYLLRANVYTLQLALTEAEEQLGKTPKKTSKKAPKKTKGAATRPIPVDDDPALAPTSLVSIDRQGVEQELQAISASRLLAQVGSISLFCAPAIEIPHTLLEIKRFRHHIQLASTPVEPPAKPAKRAARHKPAVAQEDGYDALYSHLFVWDAQMQAIVGASTVGFGDQLDDAQGFDGFRSYGRFEFSRHLARVLRQSVELGESFVASDYQRRTQVLLLLWKGIMQVLLSHPSYRYLIGPVSMPTGYSVAAKWMLIEAIRAQYWNVGLAKLVFPRSGIGALGRAVLNPELIGGVRGLEEIDKLIRDIEPTGQGVPILMKKYLQLGGKVVGFDVAPQTGSALETLLILDLCDVPQERIDQVAREFSMSQQAAYDRFHLLENSR